MRRRSARATGSPRLLEHGSQIQAQSSLARSTGGYFRKRPKPWWRCRDTY